MLWSMLIVFFSFMSQMCNYCFSFVSQLFLNFFDVLLVFWYVYKCDVSGVVIGF